MTSPRWPTLGGGRARHPTLADVSRRARGATGACGLARGAFKAKSELITIRVTPVELDNYKKEAAKHGFDLSDWIRGILEKNLRN